MTADIHWVIPERLAVLSRPRAGDWLKEDIQSLADNGIQYLVTLLTPEEEVELGLSDEIVLAQKHGMDFMRYPIPNRGVPKSPELFAETIRDLADSGKVVGVHCRSGIGRAALAAVGIMAASSYDVDEALGKIEQSCGKNPIDNEDQRQWLKDHIHLFKAQA